jgi:hypothetical protein
MNISNEAYDRFIDNFIPGCVKFIIHLTIFLGITSVLYTFSVIIDMWIYGNTNLNVWTLGIDVIPSVILSSIMYIFIYGVITIKKKWRIEEWRYFWMPYATKVHIRRPNAKFNNGWCEENCKNLWIVRHWYDEYGDGTEKTTYFFLRKKEALLFKLSSQQLE